MPVYPYMYIQYIYNTKSFACWKHTDMRTTCLTWVGSVDFWRGLVVAGTKTCALKSVSWSGGFSAHPSYTLRKWDLGCWTLLYLPQTSSLNIFQHSEVYYPALIGLQKVLLSWKGWFWSATILRLVLYVKMTPARVSWYKEKKMWFMWLLYNYNIHISILGNFNSGEKTPCVPLPVAMHPIRDTFVS